MRFFLASLLAVGATAGPVRFAPSPGWYLGSGREHACPGVPASRCRQSWSWAGTVRWVDCASCLPHRTIARLSPDGVLISAQLATEHPVVERRSIDWPPRIRPQDVVAGFEGLPGRVGVYQLSARVGGAREVYLMVFFGRTRPSAAQLAAANARLRSAQVG